MSVPVALSAFPLAASSTSTLDLRCRNMGREYESSCAGKGKGKGGEGFARARVYLEGLECVFFLLTFSQNPFQRLLSHAGPCPGGSE